MSYSLSPAGLSIATPHHTVRDQWAARLKRVVDLVLVVLLMPLAVVLVALVTVALWVQGGPVFYSQMRVGRGGRLFRLWKFRTMVPDADATLDRWLAACPEAAHHWVRWGKIPDDPRIRPLGHMLRRMSLDELPQLWNVLRGEMSLVGPRPVRPDELRAVYGAGAVAYKACVPGLSGLWQVSGRNDLGYAERVALDCYYAHHRSLGLDLWILLRTARAVLSGTGC